jgi:competence protein ComEC
LSGVDWRIVASAGDIIPATTLPGANKANPECANFRPFDNNMEDPMSVASYITFGRFRTAHLGDLTRNMEFKLMCPVTHLPPVNLFLGLHHGVQSSNSPVMVHALRPIAAIMNNGTRKGGDPETMMTMHSSPGLQDLWQVHFSQLSGQEYTQPGMFIANLIDAPQPTLPVAPIAAPGPEAPAAPAHNGKAYWIKVSAQRDGTFAVTNQRNGFSKTYSPMPGS